MTEVRGVEGPDGIDLGVTLRALRRRADLSQRQLAARAGVPKSTVSRIEAGAAWDPKFRTVERLVRAAGGVLTVGDGVERTPNEGLRDGADRNLPPHLDARPVSDAEDWSGAWWAHWYRVPRELWPVKPPDFTYDLDRGRRDRRRYRERVRSELRIRRTSGARDAWQWVAENADGDMVGELHAAVRAGHPEAPEDPREVLIEGVVVARELRGLGIGRRLVEELITQMDRSGIAVARAVADVGMPAEFLIRCGFRPEAWRPVALTLNRQDLSRQSLSR